MATIADGEYYLVPASDAALALDVQGSDSKQWSDANGTNIWVYTRSGSDGQFVHVRNVDGALELYLALTYKAVDYVADGGNVSQWDWHGGANQEWTPAAVGTLTVDGTSYTTYSLANVADSSKYLTAGSASGSNVTGAAYTGATTQQWAFVPTSAGVPTGWYSILTGMDQSLALDVAGRNSANGTNVQIWSYSGENNQIWRSVSNGDGTVGIRNCMSGKYLDIPGTSTVADGANVQQWAADGASDQRWLIYADGTLSRNGCKVPAFAIANQAGAAYRLDVAAGSTKLCTNVQLRTANGSLAQRFELAATEPCDTALAAPSGVSCAYTVGGAALSMAAGTGTVSLYPTWHGTGGGWQVRYRMRTRAVGASTFGAWGAWTSLSGATSNAGWGVPGKANATVTTSGGRVWCDSAITCGLSTTGTDLAEVQLQARRLDTANGTWGTAHGLVGAGTVTASYMPTCTLSGATFAPDGLHVSYSADMVRGNNTIVITAVTATAGDIYAGSYRFGGVEHDSTVVLPLSELSRIPDEGESLTVTYHYANVDGATSAGTATLACSYDAGKGLTISPTATVGSDSMLHVDVSGVASPRVWWQVGTEMHEVDVADGSAIAPVPLNTAYRVWVLSSTSSAWDVWSQAMDAIATNAYMWDGDGTHAEVSVDVGAPPSYGVSDDADSSAVTTNGNTYEVVTFGPAHKQSVSFQGATAAALGDMAQADNLLALNGHYAWFRTPHGDVMRVAVTSVSLDRQHSGHTVVKADMTRVDA